MVKGSVVSGLDRRAARVISATSCLARPHVPAWPGWRLLGAYPDGDLDDVGAWLLHHGDEAMLLELPPGLTTLHVLQALRATRCRLKYFGASHMHEDHADGGTISKIATRFPNARGLGWWHNRLGDERLDLCGEPLYRIHAGKHSPSDNVTVFRGVAMTGDVELNTLWSVNDEVEGAARAAAMRWLADFPARTGYVVHAIASAHLNDVRQGVDWPQLFRV